jgi:flagellar P-ring protein FlgI
MGRLFLALILCLAAAPAAAVRIKDISVLRGARDSQLVGYGLVVGLQGSGDTLRNAPFTEESVQAMLEHLGLDVHGASLRNRNVASVIVTTDLVAGTEPGARLDVTVSALGDAPSLMGGTLLMTQLQSADGVVYATAQGAVAVTGFDAAGQGETLSQGVPTAGRIPNGAIVEHETPAFPDELRSMLELKNPDYATAVRFRAHAAKSTVGRSNCFARAMSRSRGSWPRLASCGSSRTWPRASFSTREPAPSLSVRTCRSRPSR